jgi:hypothetical protein
LIPSLVAPAQAQDLEERVEWETDFATDPLWLLGLRAAAGYDGDEAYPQLGLAFGHVNSNHFYLGGHVDTRATRPSHIRAGLRLGVFFQSVDLVYGFGVSPGLLAIPASREIGAILTWGTEARLRVASAQYLGLFLEVDMLFRVLGFRDTRQFYGAGLSWTFAF